MFFVLLSACLFLAPQSIPQPLPPQVRYRPSEAESSELQWLLRQAPNVRWDRGLQQAANSLRSALVSPASPITISASRIATDRAGYPGQVRFAKLLNGGAYPKDLLTELRRDARLSPVDVALARRDFGDGGTLWLLAWSPRLVRLDPMPRDLKIDAALPFYLELSEDQKAMLYISSPGVPIREIPLLGNAHRLLKEFYVPGVHRIEVVTTGPQGAQVALLFSVYVDQAPPELMPILPRKLAGANPRQAELWLLKETNNLRADHGLRPLSAFPLFEPIAREHSALMAAAGIVAHELPGVTKGVPINAAKLAHPRARHHQNVGAGMDEKEVFRAVLDSPGHMQTLLCTTCTHISLGAALEPTLTTRPRIYVTWEVLEFPLGIPRPIERLNRE